MNSYYVAKKIKIMTGEIEKNRIYSYRIKENAYEELVRILRFPVVTGPEINGQVCRVTTYHDTELSIKKEYLDQYKQDNVVQVRLLKYDSREFVVMGSMLMPLQESIIPENNQ
jgi:hypothetical protein